MKRFCFFVVLASLTLAACLPQPAPAAATPTEALATIPADLPTTLAAYRLPAAATATAAATAQPSPTPLPRAPYPGIGVTLSVAQLPPAPILGIHVVQPGDTIVCIGRAYGVLPAAIAQANWLSQTFSITPGQALNIPAVQWPDISDGPICAAQFQSPFPGLAVATATSAVYPTPGGSPLTLILNLNCIGNCLSKDGNYLVRLELSASGGEPPYQYMPAQTYDVSVPHCNNGLGTAVVASSDGQTAQRGWTYIDVACP
jgi:LysM repeat protein